MTPFRKKILELLDQKDFNQANEILQLELARNQHNDNSLSSMDIAISLIDLGDESFDSGLIRKGLEIIEKNHISFTKEITEASIYYCTANAYQSLFKIDSESSNLFHPRPLDVKDHLAKAKTAYWKAIKVAEDSDFDFASRVKINLSNNLMKVGRVVEAIQWIDPVLKVDPGFPEAKLGLAESILFAYRSAKIPPTPFLFTSLIAQFSAIINDVLVTPRQLVEANLKWCQKHVEEIGITLKQDHLDELRDKIEFEAMNPYRKFTLLNHLSLNEHSLYCNCHETLMDDLSILHRHLPIRNLPERTSLFFDRVVSEFQFSRLLYFEALTQNENSEEKIRTSFRLCFGVFDKIAQAICVFFDLPKNEHEPIYFETFWEKNEVRWKKINGTMNVFLTGLYSIATDLSKRNGEFGFYKEYRNKLEHDLLILNNPEEFKKNTLHLLQLCRSAIFSFAFCVRIELIQRKITQK